MWKTGGVINQREKHNQLDLHHKELSDSGQMECTMVQLEYLENCLKEVEEKARILSEQLEASEEARSKLLKQVSWLEENLMAMNHTKEELFENLVAERDKCIEKLQAEVKAAQEQLMAYKLKYKKTMKKLQTDLATAKQEAAITVLELNQKIKMLCEGQPVPREYSSLEACSGGLPPVEEGDRKISLIMELSTQLSLQTERITQLEEVLEEKDRKIQQLESQRGPFLSQEAKDAKESLEDASIFHNSITAGSIEEP
uniref:coiled-coil domain-containing protein 192 n=1 Tax=Jaculus jaculus TaxID=51337 RepID=UPI001E1B0F1E|nr:coiled-coil domain-containing protein 192 [Jaculus jaculus]